MEKDSEMLVQESKNEGNDEGNELFQPESVVIRDSPPPVQSSKRWLYATIILCCYGFFKEFKPSEPFLTPYLVDFKNFTKDQVNSQIYPFWPYSYLVAALFTFLLTDLLRYTPVILLESVAYLSTRVLLIWGTSIRSMQWMQIAYGVATATEIAYFSYIYTAVSVGYFKQVTSCVRAVRLFGQSAASLLGQILISTKAFNTLELNYISFASVSVACIFAVLLPFSSCFDPKATPTCIPQSDQNVPEVFWKWLIRDIRNRLSDFIKFYSRLSLLKWSVWWALAMCGVLQVGNYVQSLWKEVASSSGVSHEYNGVVEALATLCAAGAAATLSILRVNWSVWGELTIGALSLLDCVVLFCASTATALWGAYLSHILYRTTYAFLITIASTQLALQVDHSSYAFIFGFNTFLAVLLQTILTVVVADEHGLNLPIRQQVYNKSDTLWGKAMQFVVYSGYYFVLTLIFVGAGVYKLTLEGWWSSIRLCCHEQATLEDRPSDRNIQEGDRDETSTDTTSTSSTNQLI